MRKISNTNTENKIFASMSVVELTYYLKKLYKKRIETQSDYKNSIIKIEDELYYRQKGYRRVRFYNVIINKDFSIDFDYTGDPQRAQVYYPAGCLYSGYIWTDIGWQRA